MIRFKQEPKVYIKIKEKLYNDILSIVNSTDLEITLICEISKINKYEFNIDNYLIPPQWNEYAETKTIDSEYPKWCIEQIKKGHKLNGHMHSHPNMTVTPSGYDNTFFNELIKETNSFQCRFIINKKGFITADIINEQDNYIATTCPIKIECKFMDIWVDNEKISADINWKLINKHKFSINPDLTVNIHSNYLTVFAAGKILPTKTETIKTKRRNETNEAIGKVYDNYNPTYNNFYGYTDEEIQIAKDLHMTEEELEEYLLETGEMKNANSK